jgi:hypothetical protein
VQADFCLLSALVRHINGRLIHIGIWFILLCLDSMFSAHEHNPSSCFIYEITMRILMKFGSGVQ